MRAWVPLLLAAALAHDGQRSLGPTAPAPPAAALPALLASLEYTLSQSGGRLSAPNRAQGLRLEFGEAGMAVEDREEATALVALGVTAFGRPAAQRTLGKAEARASGAARVERAWEGLREWFINQPEGVEHGWTVDQRPAGAGPLVLSVAVSGARVEVTDAAAHFESRGGRVLHYGALTAYDAAGTALPARMAATEGGLRIEVDDTSARYPLVIDPLLSTASWTAETNQASSDFGQSVASAGDVNGDGYSDVLVGARFFDSGQADEGRAFLFLGGPSGLSLMPAWTAEGNQADARLGESLASAGDVNGDGYSDVLVGASNASNGESGEGLAQLYLGSPSGLGLAPAWTAEGNQVNVSFGSSVASAGDVNGDGFSDVVVGAPGSGRAFVYLGSAGGLLAGPVLTGSAAELFGAEVASAGDVNGDGFADVLVAAPSASTTAFQAGRVSLFLGSASGPGPLPSWSAGGPQALARFGGAVATAGDVNGDGYSDVLVGSEFFSGGQSNEGRAALFLGGVTGLGAAPAWTFESDQADARLGISLASAGDLNGDGFSDVVVGASLFDNGQADEGRAFLFLGSAGGLGATPSVTLESNQAGALFGEAVASAGDVNGDGFSDVLVGANLFDNGQSNEGRAFLFTGYASGLSPAPGWTATGGVSTAYFGSSIASAGDVNGDGFSDVVVGADFYTNGEALEGRALLYLGSAGGLSVTAAWAVEGNQLGASLGDSVAGAGDVNGDGYADVLVGAGGFDNGEANEGRAFLFLGSASGLSLTPAWTAEGNQVNASFGASVASAGDVNGDGFADVLVGAERFDDGEADEGRVFLYLGGPSGLSPTPAWTAEGNQASARFGFSVASAGDVNGDGFSDVLVGANLFDNGESDEGRGFLYLGSAAGLSPTPSWTAESNQVSGWFGASVAGAGDVNGDGFSDVVVGASFFDNGQVNEGSAFLYLGSATGLSPTPSWTGESNLAASYYGVSVASAGDVNGDGFSDVVVGAWTFANEGRAFLYLGSATGLGAAPGWGAVSNQANASFGISVASAGDVNGDGFSDVVVGAYQFDLTLSDEGRAYLFFGGDAAPGVPRALQQQLGGGSLGGPIARGPPPVKLSALGFNGLAVQGRVVLETEVKPVGVRFNGGALVRSAPGVAGQRHTAIWMALTPGRYHWRARLVCAQERGRWLPFGGNSEADADFVVGPVLPVDAGTPAPDAGTPDAGATLPSDAGSTTPDGGATATDGGTADAGAAATDGGTADAGAADGGAAPADGGQPDGGSTDAPGGGAFTVGCGCGSASGLPNLLLLVLLLLHAAKRNRGGSAQTSNPGP